MEIPMYSLSSNQTTISNLSAGTYTLTVFDSVCNISFVNSYTVNEPSLITYSSHLYQILHVTALNVLD